MAKQTTSTVANHPGKFVRDTILTPKKLSVTHAAKIVGVGRPALSNFLNGKAATTPDMAARIEHAFGVPAQTLLDMQATHDATQAKAKGTPAKVMPYVPPFLRIKANDLEDWAALEINARIRLSVLIRTLVNSTTAGMTKVDFPGNDDAQRPGWDGYIDAPQGSPWVPTGLSGWEFGTNQDIKSKADGDFAKSVQGTDKTERDRTTFVFVTPRRWAGKTEWVKKNKAKAQWKDVRAYDSSDLEQWLEQSIAGQTWFANETIRPSNGVRSLDKCWSDWADVANPPLAGGLFGPAIDGSKRTIASRLSKQCNEPTVIAADSIEEALAFLAQIFGDAGGEELLTYRDRVLVFDQTGVLPKLAQGTKDFIAVASTRDVERELGPLARSLHTIVVCPRNAANTDPHVVLEPLNYETFRTSLEAMGYGRDDVTKYDNESGRSLTVLRRRLSTVPAVRTPIWASDHETAAHLIPFLFIGSWNSSNTTDQTVLMLLANEKPYDALEKECQRLAGLNDAPLWSVGSQRGVVSKIDLLFAVAGSITTQDLKRYFEVAKMILGEDDPKLDLPESERWAASIRGKSREFSHALREGISETLVLLAVHGNHLFKARLGFDCELASKHLIRELLTPLKARILEANDRDLPVYAEAAPDEFLSILEEDLNTDHPESFELMRPGDTGIFGGCPRTGLLWALESLAWNPKTLPRAVLVLAQLAEIEINDNWANKPIRSLESIFRAWMPQTSANHAERIAAVKLIAEKFPMIAWKICIKQLNSGHRTGDHSYKPSWRTDAHGFGEPFPTWGPILAFMKEMFEMAITWKNHTQKMVSDMVERLHDFPEAEQAKVWKLVQSWTDAGASDADKALVRETIRLTVMSSRGLKRSQSSGTTNLMDDATAAYQALEPTDLLNRYAWLFRENWVEASADELQDDDMDHRKREERISNLRTDALREILSQRGLPGIFEIAEKGKAAWQIGWLMANRIIPEKEIPDFILEALKQGSGSEQWAQKELLRGTLRTLQDEKRLSSVLLQVGQRLSQVDLTRVLILAPFERNIWQIVDELDEVNHQKYWSEIAPTWIVNADDEINEAIERLLAVQRPRAAFSCILYKLESVKPQLLFRLTSDMANESKDQPGSYRLEPYYIEKAFSLIDKCQELTLEQKAGLEFTYIDALAQPWSKREVYGIPNLEKYVETHPDFFVQAIVWTYKRKDAGEDPKEWNVAPEKVQHLAERGHKLLEGIERIPGHDDVGELKAELLGAWVKTVRDASAELGRLDVADTCIGKLLASSPVGIDGIWPCEPVRQVMEDVHSKRMMEGACTGLYNSLGPTWRGEGGGQERELAEKYRPWANALQYSHPFVASQLLMQMVSTYEHEANREDTEAGIRKRLH